MRYFFAAVFAFFVIYILIQASRMFILIRMSGNLADGTQKFERILEDGKPRILVAGDSTAVGVGAGEPYNSIAGRLGREYSRASIRNISENGLTAAELLEKFPEVPDGSFDFILLQIGANDIVQGTDKAQFEQALNTLFAKSKKAGKAVVALHSGNVGAAPIFPWPISIFMEQRTKDYRDIYMRLCEKHGVAYVDLFHPIKEDPFRISKEAYAPDLFHLSDKGYGDWFQHIQTTMEKYGILQQQTY